MTTVSGSAPTTVSPSVPTRAAADTSPLRAVRHALVLARRNLIKTVRTPEQLIDVTVQPIVFILLFVFVFGGALGGGDRHAYLQYLLPGLLGQGIALGSISLGQNMNTDIEKGIFDRFRALPIARSAPLVGAVLADFARYLILCVVTLGFGYAIGFRVTTNPLALLAAVALAISFALCFCWMSLWVGLKVRSAGAVQGVMFLLIFPLSFGSSVFTDPVDDARVAAGMEPGQPDHPARGRDAGADGRRGRGTNLLMTLAWMAALLGIFVPLAMRAYRTRA